MKKMHTLTVNGNAYQVSDPEAVSFAEAQGLTAAQKQQAKENLGLGGQYELIEDITLDADTTRFYRNADPNGVAYDFSAVRISVEVPAYASAPSYDQMIISMSSIKTASMIYHQANYAVATEKKRTFMVARNDGGLVEYYAGVSNSGNVTNMQKRSYLTDIWGNVAHINLTMNPKDTIIPAGTRIVIYAIRGEDKV